MLIILLRLSGKDVSSSENFVIFVDLISGERVVVGISGMSGMSGIVSVLLGTSKIEELKFSKSKLSKILRMCFVPACVVAAVVGAVVVQFCRFQYGGYPPPY